MNHGLFATRTKSSSSGITSSRWLPFLKPFCWCCCTSVDHFFREKREGTFKALKETNTLICQTTEICGRGNCLPRGIVPAHFDFTPTSQPPFPVAGACASCHHAPTADARLSVTVRLQTLNTVSYI